jgi:hypothetical protein
VIKSAFFGRFDCWCVLADEFVSEFHDICDKNRKLLRVVEKTISFATILCHVVSDGSLLNSRRSSPGVSAWRSGAWFLTEYVAPAIAKGLIMTAPPASVCKIITMIRSVLIAVVLSRGIQP